MRFRFISLPPHPPSKAGTVKAAHRRLVVCSRCPTCEFGRIVSDRVSGGVGGVGETMLPKNKAANGLGEKGSFPYGRRLLETMLVSRPKPPLRLPDSSC